jgi:hypothetical protein
LARELTATLDFRLARVWEARMGVIVIAIPALGER